MWEAQNLQRFPLNTLNSPESMQCVLKEIMNCHEVPYSLITKKAPAYPQSIRTWARGCLHNFLKNILHATTASSQPLCGKLKTSTASHSHHRPAKLRQRILLHSRYGHLVASKHICHLLLCLILHIAKLNQSALALIK